MLPLFSMLVVGACSSETTTPPPAKETARRESVPCKTGEATLPIQAFDINPDAATGTTCNIANVLDDDGQIAALDWSGNGTHPIDGHDVTGCIAAQFSDGVVLASLNMKMHPVASGCGQACTAGGENGCGTGWKVSIFAGASLDTLKWLQELTLTQADPFEYKVVVYKNFGANVVAVCREPTPATGDDIAIDALSGTCR